MMQNAAFLKFKKNIYIKLYDKALNKNKTSSPYGLFSYSRQALHIFFV